MNDTFGTERSKDSRESSDTTQTAVDFYVVLRRRIDRFLASNVVDRETSSRLLLLPDLFYMLVKLSLDSRVSVGHKLELLAAITYVISPLDLVPDFLVPFGWLDDLFVVVYALSSVLSVAGKVEESIILEHWNGNKNDITIIREIANQANNFFNRLGLLRQFEATVGKLKK